MKKTIFILMLITLGSKILGFIRELLLAFFYGSNDLTDVYFISLTIPETVYSFFGIALSTSLIPIFSELKEKHSINYENKFINNILSFILISSAVMILFIWVFTPQIVKVFALGFEGETLDIAILFTRITIVSIYFRGLLYVFKGYLQVNNSFILAEFTGLFFNFVMLLAIPLSYIYGFILIPIGFIFGRFIQVALIYPFTKKYGYKFKLYFDRKDKHLKRMLVLAVPAIFGISVNQINILVDRTLASQIQTGGISSLTYANKIHLLIQGVLVLSLATVIYSTMSKLVAKKKFKLFKNTIIESINIMLISIIPITVLFMSESQSIISIVYGRGEFDDAAIKLTSNALYFYSLGMIGFALREILTRAFYSLQDTLTPTINASIALIINIILNIILSKYLGIGGLALATSISAIIGVILLLFSLTKKIGALKIQESFIVLLKVSIASVISVTSSVFLMNLFFENLNKSIYFFILTSVYFIIYLVTIKVFRVKEINILLKMIKGKIIKKR